MNDAAARKLQDFLHALWAAEGKPRRDGDDDILGVVVRFVLGQATSKANAQQAFDTLIDRFHGNWGSIAAASTDEVARAIEIGGLSSQKAPRIQKMLVRARADFGDYTLEPLRDAKPRDALDYLLSLDGVGPTTANYALMDAAGMDLFPINGGIRRILVRVGVLSPGTSDRHAHEKVLQMLEPGEAYAAHVALVVHARRVCVKAKPKCSICAGRVWCETGLGGDRATEP